MLSECPQLVLHFVCLVNLANSSAALVVPSLPDCLPACQPACLLVYLTLIANAHRDLANDELGWGKITRCFPRQRYSSTQQHMCSLSYRYSKLSSVCQPEVAESTLNSLESQAL